MAASSISSNILGFCLVTVKVNDEEYSSVTFYVLQNLCKDIIISISFMQEHTSLTIDFGGTKPNLSVCGLTSITTGRNN